MSFWRISRRSEPLELGSFVIFALAFALSLGVSAILLEVQGKSGLHGIMLLLEGGFGHDYSLQDTALKSIPIFLCSMGVALCFRLQIWNIGAEGQYIIGTLGGCWFILNFPGLPVWLMIPGMILCAMLAGAFWAGIAAYLREKFRLNEIITTLMLNYIGIQVLNHLIYGSWKDPAGMGFPVSAYFADSAIIGAIAPDSFLGRVHWGLVTCLVVGLACSFLLKKTRLGYALEAAGSNARAAVYAGMPYSKLVIFVMMACGALAGLAGIQECSSTLGRLEPNIVAGYGFTSVVVAWLARLRTLRVAFFAFLLAGLRVGVENLQLELQVSDSFATALEGFILLTVLAGQFFDDYVLKRKKKATRPCCAGSA